MISRKWFFLFIFSPLNCFDAFAATNKCISSLIPTNTYEEFLKNPKWDGSVPFPVNSVLTANYSVESSAYTVPFMVVNISDLPKKKRNLARDLKRRSKPLTPLEAEWAALTFEYDDGTDEGVKLSTKRVCEVAEDTWDKMFKSTNVLNRGKKITIFTHIHTHPHPKNPLASTPYIGPSAEDYAAYIYRRRWLRMTNNKDVVFQAIVIPNCENCDDIVFVVTDELLDKFSVTTEKK